MKKKVIYWIALPGLMAILPACDKVPQAEIDAARSSLSDAQAAEAEIYAPEAYSAVQDSLNRALNLIEASQSKWFPNFDQSREKLEAVKELAEKVIAESENRKSEIQLEVQSMIASTRMLIDENLNIINSLPKGKEGKAALEVFNTENNSIEPGLLQIEGMLQDGQVMQAKNQVQLAAGKAQSLNQELKEVRDKYQKARK